MFCIVGGGNSNRGQAIRFLGMGGVVGRIRTGHTDLGSHPPGGMRYCIAITISIHSIKSWHFRSCTHRRTSFEPWMLTCGLKRQEPESLNAADRNAPKQPSQAEAGEASSVRSSITARILPLGWLKAIDTRKASSPKAGRGCEGGKRDQKS
jgi:hypothetical protein